MARDEIEVRRPRPPGRRPLPGPGVARRGESESGLPAPLDAAGPLDSWAGLDPTGLAPLLVRAAYRVPAVRSLEERVLAPLEQRVLRLIVTRARLVLPPTPAASDPPRKQRPEQVLTDLVGEALAQTPRSGRDDLYVAMLDRLVPDEVRILAVLADGASHPVVDVATRRRDGIALLRSASTVGRAADVVLPERTPLYVGNLVQLGLARIGPEDTTLRDGYERVLAEPQVRAARAEGDAMRRLGRAHVQRRTLRISDFGRELWDSCRPPR